MTSDSKSTSLELNKSQSLIALNIKISFLYPVKAFSSCLT